MQKSEFFSTVIYDGALPRKTFSMGEANEKRYYLECRSLERSKYSSEDTACIEQRRALARAVES
jgi:hypothetical protein